MIRRFLTLMLTLWCVATLTFGLLRLLPGGPFDRDRQVPAAVQVQLNARYHLNDPLLVQYGYYLMDLLHGRLGPSYQYPARTVNDILADAAPVSGWLGLWALLLGLGGGIGLGLLAGFGWGEQTWARGWSGWLGSLSLATPTYLYGGLLIVVFALWLRWLPAATLQTPLHWVLPVLTLSSLPFAYAFLLVKTGVEETRKQWFLRIKQAYGLPGWWVACHHVLRLALLPLVSLLGPLVATVLTGSFAVEYLFAIPGLGKHFVNAVVARDYTLVTGVTLLYSLLLVLLNTLSEWLLARLDPRLRQG